MKLINIIILCCLSTVGFTQPEGKLEKYFFDKVNQHRHKLHIDSLLYDATDYIQIANEDYCETMAWDNRMADTWQLDEQLDVDPLMGPYCVAFRMCVTSKIELEFRGVKDLEEFNLYPNNLLRNKDIKRIYKFYESDNLFLKTISVGDLTNYCQSKTTRKISIASDYKINNFRILKVGYLKNLYGLELFHVTNVFLYIKDNQL